jgi:hypothetical protein
MPSKLTATQSQTDLDTISTKVNLYLHFDKSFPMRYAIVFFLSYWCASATLTHRQTPYCSNPQDGNPCSDANGPCCQSSAFAFQCVLDETSGSRTWQKLPCSTCQALEGDLGIECYQDTTVESAGPGLPPGGSKTVERRRRGKSWI